MDKITFWCARCRLKVLSTTPSELPPSWYYGPLQGEPAGNVLRCEECAWNAKGQRLISEKDMEMSTLRWREDWTTSRG